MKTRTATLAAVVAALAGCGACDTVPTDAIQDCNTGSVVAGHVQTDILFVVDDSLSMNEEQDNLSLNLGAFIDQLALAAVEDDYQIGVTTTDVDNFSGGTDFTGGPESGHPYPRGALVAVRQNAGVGVRGDLLYDATAYAATNGWGGNRILPKGSPTLVQDFKANVLVGTSGSGKEQPFRAVRMALGDRITDGTNAGFLRPGARLAIVILSDEDDCSDSASPLATTNDQCHTPSVKQNDLDSVAEFASFLQGPIQGEERDVVVGAIAPVGIGTLDPACASDVVCNGATLPAGCTMPPPPTGTGNCCASAFDTGDRFKLLIDTLGPARTRLASICDQSFAQALEDLATALQSNVLPLEGAPADWRMLAAKLTKAVDGQTVACAIASADPTQSTPEEVAAADVIYSPPQMGGPSLTFKKEAACALSPGDAVDVSVVCVR